METITPWYVFLPVYVLLCGVYTEVGVYNSSRLLKLFLKCTPITLLAVWVLGSLLVIFVKDSDITISSHLRTQILLLGLFFSCIGDACLVFPRMFLFGIRSHTMLLYFCIWTITLECVSSTTKKSTFCHPCGTGIISNIGHFSATVQNTWHSNTFQIANSSCCILYPPLSNGMEFNPAFSDDYGQTKLYWDGWHTSVLLLRYPDCCQCPLESEDPSRKKFDNGCLLYCPIFHCCVFYFIIMSM